MKHNNTWSSACKNFNYNSTRSSQANRLRNFCSSVQDVLREAQGLPNQGMNNFFFGSLGAASEPMLIAERVWKTTEEFLDMIERLYWRSKTCVGRLIRNFHGVYLNAITSITRVASTTNTNITTLYRNETNAANELRDQMNQMAIDLNNIGRSSNVSELMRNFVRNF
jgi:hypothetical protein